MQITFHRAFDQICEDPFEALEKVISLGCTRLLTSGCKPTALEGATLIRQLIEKAAGRIIILAGAGITPENIEQLEKLTGATEFHGTKLCR
ncbi:MAG: copper homeostasis protein CutC, partial [Candidatus Cryptobacteroides sp.]